MHVAPRIKSNYTAVIFSVFFALVAFMFANICDYQTECLEAKIKQQDSATAPIWVKRQAEILRQKDSLSYRQPEEQVTLRYLTSDGHVQISAPTPLHKICKERGLSQDKLGDMERINIHILQASPHRWSLTYRAVAELKASKASAEKRVEISQLVAILFLALALKFFLNKRKKLKALSIQQEEEAKPQTEQEIHDPHAPQTASKRTLVFVCLALFIFTAFWTTITGVLFIPEMIQTYPSANYPATPGKVLDMRGHHSRSSKGGSSFIIDHSAVQFTWKGKEYITRERGLGFADDEFDRALKTGKCTVYVNEADPSKSLLVQGIPKALMFILPLFIIIGLLPAIAACVILYRNIYLGKPFTYTQTRK